MEPFLAHYCFAVRSTGWRKLVNCHFWPQHAGLCGIPSLPPMSQTIRLPDAMPDVDKPTLVVVCDSHRCRLLNVGGHSIQEKEIVDSKEPDYSDREGRNQSPSAFGKGGMVSGTDDTNQVEKHRLREFANELIKHVEVSIREQGIQAVHISAPAKFLSVIRSHMTPAIQKILMQEIDGNFVKEPAIEILVRFRPDLKEAVKALRDQENYSPRNQPPKK